MTDAHPRTPSLEDLRVLADLGYPAKLSPEWLRWIVNQIDPPELQHGPEERGGCGHCDASWRLCRGLLDRTGVPCCADCAQFRTHGAQED